MTYICINGRFLPADENHIPHDDRGFRYGDSVFETIAVHDGYPYLWEDHAERLKAGCNGLGIPMPPVSLRDDVQRLLEKNSTKDGGIRLQISRGSGGRGYAPAAHSAPLVVIESFTTPPALPPEGVKLWCSRWRRVSAQALPVHYKLGQSMNSVLALQEAGEHNCEEALLLGETGQICESASSNLLWEKKGQLYTPAPGCGAVEGVLRNRLIAISPRSIRQGRYFMNDLLQADAIVLTNAIRQAVAVNAIHPHNKKPPRSRELATWLNALIQEDRSAYASKD